MNLKYILVTGAGNGIGKELVLRLSVDPSHRVIAVSRNRNRLTMLEEELAKRNCRDRVIIFPADISLEADVEGIAAEVKRRNIRLQALINNAGKLIYKPFEELSRSEWESVYSTNVFGTVSLIRSLLPFLAKGPGEEPSHVVNISSIGGVQGSVKFPGLSAYSSSKAAIVGVTECLAEELRNRGIHLNALALGSVQTEMFSEAFPGMSAATTPGEMAEYIAGFTLEAHRFMTGKVVEVSTSTP